MKMVPSVSRAPANGQPAKQLARAEVLQKIGADEARRDKDDHGNNVVALGICFAQLEFVDTVLNDEGPAHDLCPNITSLGDDPLKVALVAEKDVRA